MRWLAPIVVAVVGLGLVGETPWAAPQVEIKAQTRLALDKVKLRADGEVEVSGQLLDKLTNDGIGSQQVVIRLGGTVQHAITEPDGRFRASFAVPPGPQPVDLRFPGGNLLDGSHLTIVTDPSRAQVTLQLRAEDTDAGARLFIIAAVEDTPTTLDVQLAAGGADDADLKPLATARSDQPYLLSRTALGGPGSKRVRATFPGDQTRQQATAEITLDLATGTKTSLEAKHTTVAYEDDVEMFGKVVDDDGKPVARASVALSSGDRRLAQGATNEDGSYKFSVEAEIVGQGQFGLQVAAEPASTYVRASRSNPVIIKIAAPQPVPVSYTVAAFLATALAAGGFFTARAKPWRKLRKAAPASELATGATDAEQDGGGLVANKPGIVSTLRRPYDDGFSGVVRDTVRGRPVADATIRITLDDQVIELVTAEDGSFAVDKLALGEWRAEVTAPGHVTERFAVSIPHRGELRGVRVDLVPVRERVFQLYRRAAEPSLPEARLWGIWSPRQIVDHVRSRRPSAALAELTDFVEEVYFSGRVPSETVLPNASEAVDRAIRERARV